MPCFLMLYPGLKFSFYFATCEILEILLSEWIANVFVTAFLQLKFYASKDKKHLLFANWGAPPSIPITHLMLWEAVRALHISPIYQKKGRKKQMWERISEFYQPLKETGGIYGLYNLKGKKIKLNSKFILLRITQFIFIWE